MAQTEKITFCLFSLLNKIIIRFSAIFFIEFLVYFYIIFEYGISSLYMRRMRVNSFIVWLMNVFRLMIIRK